MIEIKELSYSYTNKELVISNLSLKIKDNEILFLLGKNGCGKTTLLNLLINNLYVPKGKIFIDGIDIKKLSFKELSYYISYVPQTINNALDFLVIDYLLLGLSNTLSALESPSEEEYCKVIEVAREYKVENYLYKQFNHLSGGERQLIAIIRALIQNSRIVIMDEPTSALDYANQQKILEIIKQIHEKGRTIIVTSHNPNHCFEINCNVLLLKKGEKINYGKNDEIMTDENLSFLYDYPIKVIETNEGKICIKKR